MLRKLFAALAAVVATTAAAQQYPSKPVRFVVPYAAGGATDLIARTIGEKLSSSLGQPFVIDNRPGAATLLGAQLDAICTQWPSTRGGHPFTRSHVE